MAEEIQERSEHDDDSPLPEGIAISGLRRYIGLGAVYELSASLDVLRRLANDAAHGGDTVDDDFLRGLAIRASDLTNVVMSVLDNDVDERGSRRIVYGLDRS